MMIPVDVWQYRIAMVVLRSATLCSTLLMLSMTFDHFYSITRPHKAASFNTVKRAKITKLSIIIFGISFNVPFIFIIIYQVGECVPDLSEPAKMVYYWLNYVVQFAIPFVSLLTMNSVIIHTLRKRTSNNLRIEGQTCNQGQKMKTSVKQIYVILLLVASSY